MLISAQKIAIKDILFPFSDFWLTLKSMTATHSCPVCKILIDDSVDENGLLSCKHCEIKLLPRRAYEIGFWHGRLHVTPILPPPKDANLPKLISKHYLEPFLNICEEIKNGRKNSEIKKAIKNFLPEKECLEFLRFQIEILDFLAFATVWLYLEKHSAETKKWQTVDKKLGKLFDGYKTIMNLILRNAYKVKTRSFERLPHGKRTFHPKANLIKMPMPRKITETDKIIFKKNYTNLRSIFLIVQQLFK